MVLKPNRRLVAIARARGYRWEAKVFSVKSSSWVGIASKIVIK